MVCTARITDTRAALAQSIASRKPSFAS